MKKYIILVLTVVLMLSLCGCSNKVDRLIEQEQYEEALLIMEKKPDKYKDLYDEIRYNVALNSFNNNELEKAIDLLTDNNYDNAQTLLNDVQNLKSAIKIEEIYNEMKKEIEEYNPDKWNPNFDYMDSADFYFKIKEMLDETNDIIVRDNKLDNAIKNFVEIFGYEPTTIEEAENALTNLSDELNFDEYHSSEFFYYHVLDYVMTTLTRESEFVRFDLTETSGFMIIEKPYSFLKSEEISEKVFAYLLGTCENMGASISRDLEKIIITFKNTQSDSYWSRGYYYCAPNSQYSKISKFNDNVKYTIEEIGLDEVGVWTENIITNEEKYNIEYISMNAILIAEDGKHVGATSILLEDINEEEIHFTLDFDGMTLEDVKGPKCSVTIFPAVIMSE